MTPTAVAAFPGGNGRIAFPSDRDGNAEIYTMNADGSGPTNLTDNGASDRNPDWQAVRLRKKVRLTARPKEVEPAERVRLRAKVRPCEGHERDVVRFLANGKRIAAKKSTVACVGKLKVRVHRTTRFRAVSPKQDLDHRAGTSKPVKVRVLAG